MDNKYFLLALAYVSSNFKGLSEQDFLAKVNKIQNTFEELDKHDSKPTPAKIIKSPI